MTTLTELLGPQRHQLLTELATRAQAFPEYQSARCESPSLESDHLFVGLLDIVQEWSETHQYPQLNAYFVWLLKERQRLQLAPDIFSRLILNLKEILRECLSLEEFKTIEGPIDLIAWGFIQRHFSEVVDVLMSLEINLKDRVTELTLEKNKLSTIIQNITDGIMVTDFDHRIIQINKAARRILGWEQKDPLHQHVLKVLNAPELLSAMTEALDQGPGQTVSRTLMLTTPTGKKQVLELLTALALNETKEPMGIISILRDVTATRELDEAKASFLNTASHELRTPLTNIMGFISLLLEPYTGTLSDTQRDFLESALKSCHGLHRLVNDLLDLTRIDLGKLLLKLELAEVGKCCTQLVATFLSRAQEKHLELIFQAWPSEELWVSVDKSKFQHVLTNLLDNAIKFTPKGQITVGYRRQNESVVIWVQDTGIGIAKKDQSFIFDRFRQVDGTITRSFEGSGLGLAIAKELVLQHGGTLSVESHLKQGATFTITLPLANSPAS